MFDYTLFLIVRALRKPLFFFFQAEDGIRAATVTVVQTCALPISLCSSVIGYCFRLTVAHGSDEASQRNLMIYSKVLNYSFSTLAAEPEVFRFATGRIRMSGNFDHKASGTACLRCQLVKLLLGLGRKH